jgi:hypothetical protein
VGRVTDRKEPRYWRSQDLLGALRERYAAPQYALFDEVFSSVGGGQRADAIAVAMWRSRGLAIHGFEIKVSRSDWLRELKNPKKAEHIFRYCDYWWLVVNDEKRIALPEEIPAPWGVLAPQGDCLRQVRAATKLQPDPLDRPFLCSLLRTHYDREGYSPVLQEEFERGHKSGMDQCAASHKYQEQRIADLEAAIKEFEAKSGLVFNKWDAGRIGEAVQVVLNGGLPRVRREMESIRKQAERLIETIDQDLSKLPQEPAA